MIQIRSFGKIGEQDIPLITLSDGAAEVELFPYGAAIRSVRVPDRNGVMTDVCLGYDTPEEYAAQDACFGGIIGRCANRIGGARFSIDGREYRLTANEGANQLHGGIDGFHRKLWEFSTQENSVTFTLLSPDGDEGFPGNLRVQVTYRLEQGTLSIDYIAVSDADTVVNLTNHAYFNLAGHDAGPVDDHELTVRAGAFTPAGAGNIPTGEILPVEGTVLDLRSGAVLGSRLKTSELASTRGYDHNYVLDAGTEAAARLYCPRTGIGLETYTTLEGMQLYTAGFLTPRPGKNGACYGMNHAVCLETQHFPDAVNQKHFPTPVVRAGETYCQTTSYRFFTR